MDKQIDKYKFSLQACIGQGSSARVYRGTDTLTGEAVAVKVIQKSTLASEYQCQLVAQEIAILRGVRHTHIVALRDVFQTLHNTYIITDFCDSGDLQQAIEKNGRLDEQTALRVFAQILSGVRALMQQGVVHRDLKPANVLIHQGMYKLSDFGFARRIAGDQTLMHSCVGTPYYMSPQILQRLPYSSKAEVYALGALLFEMLTGATPWQEAKSYCELVELAIAAVPRFGSMQVSPGTQQLIRACLERDENRRLSIQDLTNYAVSLGGSSILDYSPAALKVQVNPLPFLNLMQTTATTTTMTTATTTTTSQQQGCVQKTANTVRSCTNSSDSTQLSSSRGHPLHTVDSCQQMPSSCTVSSHSSSSSCSSEPQSVQATTALQLLNHYENDLLATYLSQSFAKNDDILASHLEFLRQLFHIGETVNRHADCLASLSALLRTKLLYLVLLSIHTQSTHVLSNAHLLEEWRSYRQRPSWQRYNSEFKAQQNLALQGMRTIEVARLAETDQLFGECAVFAGNNSQRSTAVHQSTETNKNFWTLCQRALKNYLSEAETLIQMNERLLACRVDDRARQIFDVIARFHHSMQTMAQQQNETKLEHCALSNAKFDQNTRIQSDATKVEQNAGFQKKQDIEAIVQKYLNSENMQVVKREKTEIVQNYSPLNKRVLQYF